MLRPLVLAVVAVCLAVPSFSQEKKETPQVAKPGVNGVGVPKCISCPIPDYTKEASKADVQGTVMLHVIVNVDGRATDITLVKAVGFGLDERAVEAVKKWRFKPALDADGRPVAVQVPIQITFRTR